MRRLLFVLALSVAAFAQEHEPAKAEGAEPKHESQEGSTEIPHELEWKWLNFAILAAGIGYLAVKMGGPFLKSRSAEIRQGIVEAQEVKADAERRATEIESKIANLGKDIEQMRAGSRQEMESENARLKAETAAELSKIQARAEMEIASAAKHATQDLKAYSAELALRMAEEQLKSKMTPQVQDNLVHNFARELGGKAAHN